MVEEMARVTRPGGLVAAYVWDYAGGMQMMRHFWDVAVTVSPFRGKTGAAPTYMASVDSDLRERIRLCLESRLIPGADGRIEMTARAWAVRGVVQ